jgi:acetyltransferase-like isoleucine patch superfamily enzyme
LPIPDQPPGVFVHPQGLCESPTVGDGTRIWAFAHVLPGARIGRDCNVCDHTFIEGDVVIGDRVTVKSGVQLWDGVRLGNNVFVGPNATFTNDHFPRSKQRPERYLETFVEDGASIGANATILPGIRIGRSAMVGAGAVVTKNVPANAIVVGNPAVIVGYQTDTGAPTEPVIASGDLTDRHPLGVGDCALMPLRALGDMRGGLTPIEFAQDLPFVPRRSFLVYDVPSRRVRGEHAHKVCAQFLVAVHGRLNVMVDDGQNRIEVVLEDQRTGLYLSPMVWGVQYRFDRDTVLLVFASHPYDASDYIRDYEEFLTAVARPR